MEIKVDTTIMHQMASTSLRAQLLIEEAIKNAKSVASHNDWNCKERDSIDDAILLIQKKNELMGENMESFSRKLNEIAEQFEQFDREVVSQFAVFDSMVGDLYCINNQQVIVAPSSEAQSLVKELKVNSYWDRYHTANLFKPVSVISFPEVAESIFDGSSVIK